MLIKAEQKYIRTSPRKLRLVADMVRGMKDPQTAIVYLMNIDKRAALPIQKVIKQALGNAKNNAGVSPDEVVLKELVISQGPFYKRFRPVSRGRAHGIKKRTSHIRVILESKAEKQQRTNNKGQTQDKKQKEGHGTKS